MHLIPPQLQRGPPCVPGAAPPWRLPRSAVPEPQNPALRQANFPGARAAAAEGWAGGPWQRCGRLGPQRWPELMVLEPRRLLFDWKARWPGAVHVQERPGKVQAGLLCTSRSGEGRRLAG